MAWKVLITHHPREEHLAERLSGPITEAGYEVVHYGTILVGDSLIDEVWKFMEAGGPVVVCGTSRAIGARGVRQVVQAAYQNPKCQVFVVQMEDDADIEAIRFKRKIADYSENPQKAITELIDALKEYFPLDFQSHYVGFGEDVITRYIELALESSANIDLANLREDDPHIATKPPALQSLYVGLRVRDEGVIRDEGVMDVILSVLQGGPQTTESATAYEHTRKRYREPIGHKLKNSQSLIVLGDPGSGKTTMMRWLVTAYLLRYKRDPMWNKLPDADTLPDLDWLPIIIRCRDLDEDAIKYPLEKILRHSLRKLQISDAETNGLWPILERKLKSGQLLLLFDGLDEIADPPLRAHFCAQLDGIRSAHKKITIIVTSRTVGYKESSYRLQRGFDHVIITDLSREDKDEFARRWCALTETPDRFERATEELIRDIHSTDRIERITGNPMLLTTVALVKRRSGRLPIRRSELYWEALEVLLNWRRVGEEPIDRWEALPQLEYLAYAMCEMGVKQLPEDDLIKLFQCMREEYPNIYDIRKHSPREFLRLLERRTGILVEAGYVRDRGMISRALEFRHLTFQEYLAARALVERRFPDPKSAPDLVARVADLAGRTATVTLPRFIGKEVKEVAVTVNWHEALRLCVASCRDDEVDSVLLAILRPLQSEKARITARTRAVLAALCLADEPNVREETASEVLNEFAKQITRNDGKVLPRQADPSASKSGTRSSVDTAALELDQSRWAEALHSVLTEEFQKRPLDDPSRWNVASLDFILSRATRPQEAVESSEMLLSEIKRIASSEAAVPIESALMSLLPALSEKALEFPGITSQLLTMLTKSQREAQAAAVALEWLNKWGDWKPDVSNLDRITSFVGNQESDSEAVRFLIPILGRERFDRAVNDLINRLEDCNASIRQTSAEALGEIGNAQAVPALISRLNNDEMIAVERAAIEALGGIRDERALEPLVECSQYEDSSISHAAIKALGQVGNSRAIEVLVGKLSSQDQIIRVESLKALLFSCKEKVDRTLLSIDFDDSEPFLDPQNVIDDLRVAEAAKKLKMSVEEVRRRYEALAGQFMLKLSWLKL